jgi:hypothetical protein
VTPELGTSLGQVRVYEAEKLLKPTLMFVSELFFCDSCPITRAHRERRSDVHIERRATPGSMGKIRCPDGRG